VNKKIPLHWSFDYNQGAQKPDYAQELIKLLQWYEAPVTSDDVDEVSTQHKRHVYQILPNYWRGYNRKNNQDELVSIGEVVVDRELENGDIWEYNVHYRNETNGENIKFHFSCRDEIYRPLHEDWHVDVHNSCIDSYSKLSWDGDFTSDSEIQLRIHNTKINAGKVENNLPITCNWTLFDVFPALINENKKIEEYVDIAILDDLEQLRPKCRIGYLDTIEYPIPLEGYFLYGTGLLPSYWWVDAYGNTVIVSSVFETLVLKEITVDTA